MCFVWFNQRELKYIYMFAQGINLNKFFRARMQASNFRQPQVAQAPVTNQNIVIYVRLYWEF